MAEYKCHCGKPFRSYRATARYCSNACKAESQASISPARVTRLYQAGSTQREIAQLLGVSQKSVLRALRRGNVACRVAAKRNQVGSCNTSWKGGRTKTPAGYIKIRMPDHHRAHANGYVCEHILVAEQEFGPLPLGYVVHHRNHRKDDNRPENLQVMSASDHVRLHNDERQ